MTGGSSHVYHASGATVMNAIPSGFPDLSRFEAFLKGLGNEVRGARMDLSVAEAVIPRLDPNRFAPAIVVAGTNGKGSTAFWMAEALRETGLRVGLYTSPHILSLTERVRIDGTPVSGEELARGATAAAAVVREMASGLSRLPSFYEWVTFAAAACFAEAACDVHVLEVGLGGRLDAVNVADPILSVITCVDLDHTALLGDTVEGIAREKMGVLRPGAPLVLGPQDEWALPLSAELETRCARVVRARYAYETELASSPGEWPLGLEGDHQRYNAATAVTACRELGRLGFPVDEGSIRRALRRGGWPARLESLGGDPRVVVDGAHNPHAVRELVSHLAARPRPPAVVFGAMRDKAMGEMLELLHPVAGVLILTGIASDRAATREDYGAFLRSHPEVSWVPDPAKALDEAIHQVGRGGEIFVLGSLYLAGAIKGLAVHGFPPFDGASSGEGL